MKKHFDKNIKNSIFNKINNFFAQPLVIACVTILAAVLGAVAGAAYTSKTTENEIVKKINDELQILDENKTLAHTIDQIKTELEDKDKTIEEQNSEILKLKDELEQSYSLEKTISSLKEQIETEKAAREEVENKLAEYIFIKPELLIDDVQYSIDESDLLSYKDRLYFGPSILRHFFDEDNIVYNDGKLSISTDNGKVTVNPIAENGVDLLSMEVTHPNSYIRTDAIMDNKGTLHNKAVHAHGDGSRYIEYRLDKKYKWFKCNAFVTKEASNKSYDSQFWSEASITIEADNGVKLWGTEAFSRESDAQESDYIDISKFTYIRITFSNAGFTDYKADPAGTYLAIGNPTLFVE